MQINFRRNGFRPLYRLASPPVPNIQRFKPWLRGPGIIILKNDGTLVDEADVTQIQLKNPAGEIIADNYQGFYKDTVFWARVYEGSSSLFDKGLNAWSFHAFSVPTDPSLPAGDYTYQITTADGSSMATTLTYPGDTESIVPDSLNYEWLADGSLKLSWQAQSGIYEQFRVVGSDQDWRDLFMIRTPPSVTMVTLPKWSIDEITAIHGTVPTIARWQVQTRTYGDSGFDSARGVSDNVEIPWPQD